MATVSTSRGLQEISPSKSKTKTMDSRLPCANATKVGEHRSEQLAVGQPIQTEEERQDATKPSDEQMPSPHSPPFTIRHFVSTVRGKDFSKCWPFPRRILQKCLIHGIKVDLPPFEPPPNRQKYISPEINMQSSLNTCSEQVMLHRLCQENSQQDLTKFEIRAPTEVSRKAAAEEGLFCDANAHLPGKQPGVNRLEGFKLVQKSVTATIVKTSPETFCDDDIIDVKTEMGGKSGVQTMVHVFTHTDVSKELGADIIAVSECSHSQSDHVTTLAKESTPECGSNQAVQDNQSLQTSVIREHGLLSNGCSMQISFPSQGDLNNLKHPKVCTSEDLYQDERKGNDNRLGFINQPAASSIEFDSLGHHNKAEKGKNNEDLGLLRLSSDASMLQVCPVCLKFSSTSNTALNAHIDHCLAGDETRLRPFKRRIKLKKMRSVVDIYAAAPARTLEDLESSSQQWALNDEATTKNICCSPRSRNGGVWRQPRTSMHRGLARKGKHKLEEKITPQPSLPSLPQKHTRRKHHVMKSATRAEVLGDSRRSSTSSLVHAGDEVNKGVKPTLRAIRRYRIWCKHEH